MRRPSIDPAEIAVVGHALHSVAAEMGAALRRTAFSPNIKERRDYSSAVFTGEGDLIAMGDDMPVHLGSMPMSVSAALEAMRFAPGDVALLNDPYRGGTHLPDLTMVAPLFLKGRARPAFYVANRAHHADVGGMHPGSMGPCREIAQEGIRIPPVKLMRGGKMDAQVLAILLANVRTPAEREGDLMAQLGACRIGIARMQVLVERLGFERLCRGVGAMLDGSERVMRGVLACQQANGERKIFWTMTECGRDGSAFALRCETIQRTNARWWILRVRTHRLRAILTRFTRSHGRRCFMSSVAYCRRRHLRLLV